jgi:acylphosphatase
MKVFFVVHGFVQGVGYRWLVKKAARKDGIKGMVRNAANGTVEIIAEAEGENLKTFEKDINVDIKSGPSVLSIEKHFEGDESYPNTAKDYEGFIIEH